MQRLQAQLRSRNGIRLGQSGDQIDVIGEACQGRTRNPQQWQVQDFRAAREEAIHVCFEGAMDEDISGGETASPLVACLDESAAQHDLQVAMPMPMARERRGVAFPPDIHHAELYPPLRGHVAMIALLLAVDKPHRLRKMRGQLQGDL